MVCFEMAGLGGWGVGLERDGSVVECLTVAGASLTGSTPLCP